MSAPAPSLWCGCPSGPPDVVVDSNGVEVCGRCTGAWALRAGEPAQAPEAQARLRLVRR